MYFKIAFISLLLFSACSKSSNEDWESYNGGNDRNHFSLLDEINTDNVAGLKQAWIYAANGADTLNNSTQMQCNPIVIAGILYGVSPDHQAFALKADTGEELWRTELSDETFNMTSRGVSYWKEGQDERVFFGYGAYLYALDAKSGLPIDTFGEQGRVYLVDGIRRPGADEYAVLNTPVSIYKNNVIVGCRVAEGPTALLGDIRSFDAKTGKLLWTFKTIPEPGQEGYETWEPDNYKNLGGANNWMGMAVDEEQGIVFAPTGSAAFDFYGGNRKGDNLFANCLIALDANTGKKLWHFQTVHHDIWDRDIPAPPNLFTLTQNGKKRDVVSVLSKQGFMFVFDRSTGEPIFPIEERPVQVSNIAGELAAKTQPFPTSPKPFTGQSFTAKDVNAWSKDKEELIDLVKNAKTGEAFIPIGFERTVFYPGTDGGAQWGGAAVDENGVMYIPAKQNPVYTSLKLKNVRQATSSNIELYKTHCQSCHGVNREGNEDGTYPSIQNAGKKFDESAFNTLMQKGRGRMPSFSYLKKDEISAIYKYLKGEKAEVATSSDLSTTPYGITGYNRWYDSEGYPVSNPPWGTLTAIDMNSAEHLWQVPLGVYPELLKKGIAPTGTDNYGGPVVTAGGLVFIAATKDEKIRAFDRKTGKILWEADLPAAGYASPSVYAVNGKQYLVIACGGGKLKTKSGDKYVAFSL